MRFQDFYDTLADTFPKTTDPEGTLYIGTKGFKELLAIAYEEGMTHALRTALIIQEHKTIPDKMLRDMQVTAIRETLFDGKSADRRLEELMDLTKLQSKADADTLTVEDKVMLLKSIARMAP